ncbi:hypothetical protein [Atlantibacter hermannii]|uniref:hypothetical protein n=1 Tax=Atlantibacter hermannii TaxID=565 RepID=UPI002FDE881F
MDQKLLELKEKLDSLHTSINALSFPYENLNDLNPYTHPFLHSTDLQSLPKMLSEKISKMTKFEPSEDDITTIDSIMYRLDLASSNFPYLPHTSAEVSGPAINSFLTSLLYIYSEINELFSFATLKDKNLLPKNIIHRLDLYHSNLDSIEDKTGDLENKINAINDAYDAAEGLPTTVKKLRETNDSLELLNQKSLVSSEEIEKKLTKSLADSDEINKIKTSIIHLNSEVKTEAALYLKDLQDKAQTYIDKCEEAFRTTTSKGLAGAFEDKAKKLNQSIRWWVAGLVFALLAGAVVGYMRLHALENYLANPNSSGIKLFIQFILSGLSIGAPLWFAWLATKQIGQRFRLAEDYEFKASVSKAYEGYRREAVQLDSDFAQRLFGNALTRLEEPPLRFVGDKSFSSPLMEILSSDSFKKMIENGGEQIDTVLAKAGLSRKKDNEAKDSNIKNPSDSPEE